MTPRSVPVDRSLDQITQSKYPAHDARGFDNKPARGLIYFFEAGIQMLKKATVFALCFLFVSAILTGSEDVTGHFARSSAVYMETEQPTPTIPVSQGGTSIYQPSSGASSYQSSSEIDPLHPPAETTPSQPFSGDTIIPAASPSPDAQESAQPPQETPGPETSHAVSDRLPPLDKTKTAYIEFHRDILVIISEAQRKAHLHGDYGVFVMDLATGLYCGRNENLTRIDDGQKEGFFNSASVIKMFQGYILCDMLQQGELDEGLYYEDKVTGRRFKLLPMMTYMISHSDNNYSNAVMRLVGNTKSNEVLNRLGIVNSRIYGEMSGAIGYSRKNNLERYGTEKRCARITPRDAGLILYNVYINKENNLYLKTMHEGLLGNIYNTRIPVGIRRVSKRYAVAHKTGTNSGLGVYNDAGIIYCKNPFILAAFTQSATSTTGEAFIRNLAEDLTRYFDAKASL
jgi:beta-lactamase class A